jgi:hypothetical protein
MIYRVIIFFKPLQNSEHDDGVKFQINICGGKADGDKPFR